MKKVAREDGMTKVVSTLTGGTAKFVLVHYGVEIGSEVTVRVTPTGRVKIRLAGHPARGVGVDAPACKPGKRDLDIVEVKGYV
jgi:hypothetical protein